MISNLEINNFKGLEKLQLTDFKRFNLFIGKNDVGKSTILESIFMFKAALINPPQFFPSILRNHNRHHEGRELWYLHQTGVDPTIKMQYYDQECILTLHSNFKFDNVDVRVQFGNKGNIHLVIDSLFTQVRSRDGFDFINQTETHLKNGIVGMEYLQELFFKNTQEWEKRFIPASTTGGDDYDSTVTAVRWENYTGNDNRIAIIKNNQSVFLDALGEGHKSGLAILKAVSTVKDSIILIEEIETHQHPSSLWEIIEKIIKFCRENNNQIFITTHSPEVLLMFEKYDDVSFYHLQRLPEKPTSVDYIKPDNIQMIRDLGWNIGNLLRFTKIFIVEGPTDEAVFRNAFYITKGFWPDEVGISILPAGDNDTKQKELIKGLAYYDKKIFIQRDKDDKKPEHIKQTIIDSFVTELQGIGYTKIKNDDEEVILTNKLGVTKRLVKNNLFVTEAQKELPNVQRHATDDYLLLLIQNDPSIINQITGSKKELPEFKGINSKEILEQIFGSYDTSKAIEIIKRGKKETLPPHLLDIIEKIFNN